MYTYALESQFVQMVPIHTVVAAFPVRHALAHTQKAYVQQTKHSTNSIFTSTVIFYPACLLCLGKLGVATEEFPPSLSNLVVLY